MKLLEKLLINADAIVIGAGAGLSTASGLSYSGKRFTENFQEYIERYGMKDMYSAAFYPFSTQEEKWGYWSKHILLNRYEFPVGKPYQNLLQLVKGKDYFVITTNVDHQFYKAGFPKEKIFATQGDYGLFQCRDACHNHLYENEKIVREMVKAQKDCCIPSEMVPKCPACGKDMTTNLRCDQYFVEDNAWQEACERYETFLEEHKEKNIVFLELGVGMNTPGIIKYPFWRMTNTFPNAHYICMNLKEAYAPKEIEKKSVCIEEDIASALERVLT